MHRLPLRYEAPLRSIVFLLGMYEVGGHYLGQADQLPIVEVIGAGEDWIALAAWTLTFLAMLQHLASLTSATTALKRTETSRRGQCAAVTESSTNTSHGKVQSCTDQPRRQSATA